MQFFTQPNIKEIGLFNASPLSKHIIQIIVCNQKLPHWNTKGDGGIVQLFYNKCSNNQKE